MRVSRSLVPSLLALGAAGCADPGALAPRAGAGSPDLAEAAQTVVGQVTGSGHHTRIVGGDEGLTTFSYNALKRADGSASGEYQFDFRAGVGFSVHGPVTCVTFAGNAAWIGGTVARINSPDPADQSLVGVDMWWRVQDNGQGAGAPPDLTSSIGFKFPTTTITAESWCRDQPQLLLLRAVESGNIQVSAE